MEAEGDSQSSGSQQRGSTADMKDLHPHRFKDDVRQRARPKTSINREEAKQYEFEGQESQDIDPTCEIYFTSEIQIHVSAEERIINEFKILDTIGKGAYSKVKHVVRQYTDDEGNLCEDDYAMKMMHKPTLKRERWAVYGKDGKFDISNALEKVYSEIEVWSQAHHENVVKLFELIEAEGHDYVYLIIELWDLGQISRWDFRDELYHRNQKIVDHILETHLQGREFSTEEEKIEAVAKVIFRDVITGIEYLHLKNIVHRDIKLDNILVSSRDSKAKISDFSVSCQLATPEDRMYNWDGTIAFTAPESHVPEPRGFLVLPTDIWSIGVSLYTYIAQKVPFYAESELEMQINAQKKEVPKVEGVSETWNDIMQKMMAKDPSARPTASELLLHPWFEESD